MVVNSSLIPSPDPKSKEALMTFIYGRPVRSDEFLGRESELLTIFNRLSSIQSTAIVGEPHIGKTSLLLQISDSNVQKRFLSDTAKKFVTVFTDLQPISVEYTPFDFWNDALEPLREKPGHSSIAIKLNHAKEEKYKNTALRRLFEHIAERNQVLVLLLDEFDRLLSHPNFKDSSFFAGMRSLSTITGGLVIITSSRLSVAEMNIKGHELLGGNVETSPFFNSFIEIKLRPFSPETANQLLQRVPNVFTPQEILFIRRVAGCHPFLLQAMAATLYETPKSITERQVQAAEVFYQRISSHFDTLWQTMEDKVRTTSVILSLIELGGRSTGKSFSIEEIENVSAFDTELRKLEILGLAEKVKDGRSIDFRHGLMWRGEPWTICAQVFTWWVRDEVISKGHELKEPDEWLADKKYRLLLTEGQWNELVKLVKSAPEYLTKGVGSLAKSIIQELIRPK